MINSLKTTIPPFIKSKRNIFGILSLLIFKGKADGKQGFVSIDEETLAPVKGEKEINIKLPEAGKYTILESTK